MKGSRIEIYVPILLRLANDHVNYNNEEISYFQTSLLTELNGIIENKKSMKLGNDISFKYSIQNFYVHDDETSDYKQKYKDLLKNIEVFYSGKRIILKYIFINDGNVDLEDLYAFVLINSSGIIKEKFIAKYNWLIKSKKSACIENREEKIITMYYSYIVSIIKNDKHILHNIENYYKQYAYKVSENGNKLFSRKKHLINVDNRKTVVFTGGNTSEYFRSVLINYVYMYILQFQRLSDNSNDKICKEIDSNFSADESIINKYNRVDEKQLIIFCNNAMNLLSDKI